ncbi:MAG: AraC family transcriptional regulator [Clostridia bacterium]|nr:AraC family transcriptional regulator [Clostridia bacterium]
MKRKINISDIPDAPRTFFEVDYIFPGIRTVDAFPKENFETGFHEQAFYEINIITDGEGYHALGTQLLEAKRGDVFVVPPYQKHAFIGGEGFDCYHFMVSPHYLQKNLPIFTQLPSFFTLFEIGPIMSLHNGHYLRLNLSDRQLNEIISILDRMHLFEGSDIARSIHNECIATMAITLLCEAFSETNAPTSQDGFFAESINVIMQRYNEKLTIEELSAIAGLSRTAYIEKFKKITGMSPRQFILRQRINAAKRLLTTTEKTVAKIADEVGFFDTSHFVKTFTAICKMTPLQYREAQSK